MPEESIVPKQISGVYAAVLTPRHPDDSVDVPSLARLIQFLLAAGISTFALNGATGEYPLTTPTHLRALLATVKQATAGQSRILCGIGAPGTAQAIELAAIAQQEGVHGLLLPMPYFFPYQQQDLDAFCRTVAASTTLPILLYNLPQFTSGLEKETVLSLIREVENIIGIKDSSGSLDILRHMTQHAPDACRIVGNDSALAPALRESVLDGVVSGVACVLPQLISGLYAEPDPTSPTFDRTTALLDEFITQLNPFPTPWGLKWAAESLGLLHASFAQPVAPTRQEQAAAFAQWFREWQPRALAETLPLDHAAH